MRSIADRFGVDGAMALENVLTARAWSSEQQCEMLIELAIRSVIYLRDLTHSDLYGKVSLKTALTSSLSSTAS